MFVQPFGFEVPNYAPDEEMVILAKGFEEHGVDLNKVARDLFADDAGQLDLRRISRMLVAVYLAVDAHALAAEVHVDEAPFYLTRKPPG